jgi:hypothetical protein
MAYQKRDPRTGPFDGRERSEFAPNPGGGVPDSSVAAAASGLNVVLGLWLIVAPWVLDYSGQDNAVWNRVVVGAAIAVLAITRMVSPVSTAPLSWVNVVLGGWLVVAPFVLTYNDTTETAAIYWNDIVVGVLVLILAAISAVTGRASGRGRIGA